MYAIGLDLGTTNVVAAGYALGDAPGKPAGVLNLGANGKAMPACLAFDTTGARPAGRIIVGEAAAEQAFVNPDLTIYGIKRMLADALWTRQVGDRVFAPHDVLAEIVRGARERIEARVGEPVHHAVVAVPTHFGAMARQRILQACRQAGIEVAELISEPVAAALAYGWTPGSELPGPQRVLVVDVGSGSADVAVLQLAADEATELAAAGSNDLNGDRMTETLAGYLAERVIEASGLDVSGRRISGVSAQTWARVQQRVYEVAERAKVQLSARAVVAIDEDDLLSGYGDDQGRPLALRCAVRRDEYEAMIRPDVEAIVALAHEALERAGIAPSALDRVLLVGGVGATPALRLALKSFTARAPKLYDPSTAVARGAALYHCTVLGAAGASEPRSDPRPEDRRAHAIGAGCTPRVHPLATASIGVCLTRTDAHSGIVVDNDMFDVVIPAGAPLPVRLTRTFVNAHDAQRDLQILVYEGNSPAASQNALLGEVVLGPFEPAPRGTHVFDVTFELDRNKTLTIGAMDRTEQVPVGRVTLSAL